MKVVIAATETADFCEMMRFSQNIEHPGRAIIPLQSHDEVRRAARQGRDVLLVIDPQHILSPADEILIHELLTQQAHWCSHRYFLGNLKGFARIQSIHDLLEWIRWNESTLMQRIAEQIVCASCRLMAVFAGIMLIPAFVAIASIIKISSPGPVFYRQIRVGLHGRHFKLVKFRTMRVDAESDGPRWSTGDEDVRAFPFGRFLRKAHLDELPQLWNVIRGELCFVGPRPERPEFHSILEEHIPHFRVRTRVKPGITGWAQIRAGYAATVEDSRKKIEHDLFFMNSRGPRLRLAIIFRTLLKILHGIGSAGWSQFEKNKEIV